MKFFYSNWSSWAAAMEYKGLTYSVTKCTYLNDTWKYIFWQWPANLQITSIHFFPILVQFSNI